MSKEIKAYQCEKCGAAWMSKEAADMCCKNANKIPTCRVCGGKTEHRRTICPSCLAEKRYQEGTKIKYSEYKTEWLYDEDSERYYRDIDEMAEYYDEIETEMPKWCFGCYEVDFRIDIDHALENAAENMYEDFDYSQDSVDLKELYDFVEKWNEKQTAKTYESDYKQIILLNE